MLFILKIQWMIEKSNRKKLISYVQWPHSIRCKIIMNNISFLLLLLLLPLPSAVAVTADDAAVAFVWVVFSIFVCTVEKNGRAVCFCLPRLTKQKQIKHKNKA